jgi:hypothetical protein
MRTGFATIYLLVSWSLSNIAAFAGDLVVQPQATRTEKGLFREFNVLSENDDLRSRLLEPEIIDGLLSRKQVFLFMAGIYFNSKHEQIQIDKQEVPVTDSMTVADILDSAGMKEWKGGQPQIKLIQSNRIIQSPLICKSDDDRKELELFLKARVHSGDVIYISRLQ